MENKKKEYTGMKAVVIEFNREDIIATSGCESMAPKNWMVGPNFCGDWAYTNAV